MTLKFYTILLLFAVFFQLHCYVYAISQMSWKPLNGKDNNFSTCWVWYTVLELLAKTFSKFIALSMESTKPSFVVPLNQGNHLELSFSICFSLARGNMYIYKCCQGEAST